MGKDTKQRCIENLNLQMNLYLNAIEFAASFVILLVVSLVLRYLGVIQKSDAALFSKLIVNVVLPALLVSSLSKISANFEILKVAASFLVVEIMLFGVAFVVGRYVLNLPKVSLGVFVLCSTVGSTAILGIAYISFVFNGEVEAVGKGLLISQLAVGIPAYIFCPIVCMWSGDADFNKSQWFGHCKSLLMTPTIVAILIGLVWSFVGLPTSGGFIGTIFTAMDIIGRSLVFLVAILLGLTIQRIPFRENILVVFICAFFILVAEPLLLFKIQTWLGFDIKDIQICYFLSSMPAAYTIIAYAVRYGADVPLASTLVVSTKLISIVTIPTMMPFLGIFHY
jgi:predicted permease